MRKLLAAIFLSVLLASPALADWTGKNAAGATITFKNPVDCTSVVCVPIAQPSDGTNAAAIKGASTSPSATDPALTIVESPNSWFFTAGGTVAHGCNPAGYSLLGCAGQIDDDIKGPFPLSVNGATQGATGVTPGVAQTGTIFGLNTDQTSIGGSKVVADPCQVNTTQTANINLSASGAAQIIAAVASKKIYVCHAEMNNNAAEGVLVIEGTGVNCGTGTAAVFGSTSAGGGYNFAANGGISVGMGGFYVWSTNTAGDALCLNPSAATQLTGVIKYVVQ